MSIKSSYHLAIFWISALPQKSSFLFYHIFLISPIRSVLGIQGVQGLKGSKGELGLMGIDGPPGIQGKYVT